VASVIPGPDLALDKGCIGSAGGLYLIGLALLPEDVSSGDVSILTVLVVARVGGVEGALGRITPRSPEPADVAALDAPARYWLPLNRMGE